MTAPQTEAEQLHGLEALIASVAKQYAHLSPVASFEDYQQELRVEAVGALRRWSPEGGASVSTFVYRVLVNACQNKNRERRLRGYKTPGTPQPTVLSLNHTMMGPEDGDVFIVDVLTAPDDTEAEAQARCYVEHVWAFVDSVLGDRPRLLRALELCAGRRGEPRSLSQAAARLGVSRMTVSNWLHRARALLLADPRSREFIDP